MLTLKEPIKLNIANGLGSTQSDAFYERIAGNYDMMSAHITPKDLLFFLSAPPELPEDLGGMTTFAVQNNVSDNREITMDVVNNVVNRILLSQTNSFTYQDQVYIDTVLAKLGITDINLFMKQVQKLSSQHSDMHQLLKLYRQEISLQKAAELGEEPSSVRRTMQTAGEEPQGTPPARYYLHNEIYNRLDTKSIYDVVNAFQQEQAHFFGSFQKNELMTSEQLNISNLLELSDMRRQLLKNEQLSLTYAVNHFELGDMLPPPENETDVLTQAAAAALVSTVEHVLVQKLSRQESSSTWLELENALSETVENSISRFQSYHSGDAIYLVPEADISIENKNTYSTEINAIRDLVTLHRQYPMADSEALRDMVYRQQLVMLSPESQQTQEDNSPYPREAEFANVLQEPGHQISTENINQFLKKEFSNTENVSTENNTSEYLLSQRLLAQAPQEQSETPPRPVPMDHPISDAEAQPELIAQELAEIGRQNRQRFQQLQGVRAEKIGESIPVPDKQRIMSDALRSIQSPEAVLREALESPPAELEQKAPPLPPDSAAYLSGADAITRNLLESVMLYERDPEAAARNGILREANIGELNAAVTIHPPRGVEVLSEARRIERETVQLTERADTILEKYTDAGAVVVPAQSQPGGMPKAPIIHKQEQNTLSDEILERLEQQRSTQKVTHETTDIVTQKNISETVQNDVNTQVVTQTTEDITQLVNRAISKQMSTISDKVYHQMEKRLQTERSRRGRF